MEDDRDGHLRQGTDGDGQRPGVPLVLVEFRQRPEARFPVTGAVLATLNLQAGDGRVVEIIVVALGGSIGERAFRARQLVDGEETAPELPFDVADVDAVGTETGIRCRRRGR